MSEPGRKIDALLQYPTKEKTNEVQNQIILILNTFSKVFGKHFQNIDLELNAKINEVRERAYSLLQQLLQDNKTEITINATTYNPSQQIQLLVRCYCILTFIAIANQKYEINSRRVEDGMEKTSLINMLITQLQNLSNEAIGEPYPKT